MKPFFFLGTKYITFAFEKLVYYSISKVKLK